MLNELVHDFMHDRVGAFCARSSEKSLVRVGHPQLKCCGNLRQKTWFSRAMFLLSRVLTEERVDGDADGLRRRCVHRRCSFITGNR